MAPFSFASLVMTSLPAALLAACGTGGDSDYTSHDHEWYELRQDEIGCMGEAQRSGLFPGSAYDSYVINCVNDRESERD